MRSNPIPGPEWVQALADNGAWVPPPEWSQDYPWIDQLPRALGSAVIGNASPSGVGPMVNPSMQTLTDTPWNEPASPVWSDIPDWLHALNADTDYVRGRVIESPYGGWGGGAMQARRRGLR